MTPRTKRASQYVSTVMAIVPIPGTDWTNDERAEIRRLELVCDASEDWSLECSHTDAGDPWCVVYDRHQERIILHIALIERQYVLVWPREQRSEKTSIMAVVIDLALRGCNHMGDVRVEVSIPFGPQGPAEPRKAISYAPI